MFKHAGFSFVGFSVVAGTRRLMRTSALAVCSVLLTTVLTHVGFASTVVPPTLPQMVQKADRIFVGHVVDVRSYWSGTVIRTDVTFSNSDTVKGPSSPQVRLTFLGGTIGDVSLEVAGTPQFTIGDEQVVFAVDTRQISPIVGFWHGRVRISRDVVTGAARVLRHDGTPFSGAAALTEAPPLASTSMIMPMRLDAFLSEIRSLVAAGAAR